MPVYLRSDKGTAGESCLLGTNVVLPLGLMVLGPGVETREVSGEVGCVKLIRAEWVPGRCGVVVVAIVEGCSGTVMVEPLLCGPGVEIEQWS